MPSSRAHLIAPVVKMLMQIAPKSVLDIGIGFGKFGFLAREYTDVWRGRYHEWRTRIDGIEIFPDYVTEIQKKVYSHIYIGNVLDVLPTLKNYDLVICVEVLEHLNKKDGIKLLELIKQKSRFAFISTPESMSGQGEVNGNPYEKHLHQWTPDELRPYGILSLVEKRSLVLLTQNP